MKTNFRQRDERFEFADGCLVRTVTDGATGKAYQHRCTRKVFETVAHTINETPADGDGFSLAFSLRQSADKIRASQSALRAEGARLAASIDERRRGEHQLVVNTIRLLIALVWGFLAFRLDREALAAQIFGTPIFGGAMPVADAQILARVFMTLAIAGVAAAMIGGWLTMATGGASNNALRDAAARLGTEAAEIAKEFDKALDQYRARMDRRLARAADAVEELSRMHMTALESAAFFSDVQFLTDPDRSEAARKFRGYLANAANGGGGGALSFGAMLALLAVGFLLGLIVANIGAAPATGASAAAAGSLLKYPLALLAEGERELPGAHRALELRPLALGEIEAEAHRVGHGQDVGEQDRRVERLR